MESLGAFHSSLINLMNLSQQVQSPKESALYLARSGRDLAHVIAQTVIDEQPDNWRELLAFSTRLAQCNDRSNLWYAEDLHSKTTGEMFDGHGRFWQCNLKVCQYCQSSLARRNRTKLRYLLENTKVITTHRRRFVTLTMTNPSLPLVETRALINYAWSLFRKREFFKANVDAGSKSEEFTLTRRGFHYHIHCIWIARYMSYASLRHHWTECVSRAFDQAGLQLTVANKDGLLSVVDKPLSSTEGSIKEVTKYLTKTSSWSKLKRNDLLQIASIRRWHRVFDVFGTWRQLALKGGVAGDEAHGTDIAILDTNNLSDGSMYQWRDDAQQSNLSEHCERLTETVRKTQSFRLEQLRHRFPYASMHGFKGRPFDAIGFARDLEQRFVDSWTLKV